VRRIFLVERPLRWVIGDVFTYCGESAIPSDDVIVETRLPGEVLVAGGPYAFRARNLELPENRGKGCLL
jgi:hypothetical protein